MSRIGAEFSQLFNLDNLWSALMWASNRRIGGLRVDKSIPEILLLSEATEGNLQRTPNHACAIDARQKFQMFHPMVSAGLDVRVDCLYREKRTKKLEKPAFWRQWCL
ncbi:Hypothetical predicted protein [Cloeon dipterum]|uniref:Uncharacterized protein n=1 Tax=Cloeon dipterum TaxID=197152 RepID=A0A8S1DSX7_9INSE|nr:Hypothetical predicted protein [Cloeon dipterum]